MLLNDLAERCENKCELCFSESDLEAYTVPPRSADSIENQVALCALCMEQIKNPQLMDLTHMRCVKEAIWSVHPAVQVLSYRLLRKMESEAWAQETLNMIYLDESTKEWAEAAIDQRVIHKDSNGQVLQNGDTVVLIKDLDVKGSSLTAKRGTSVRRIRLDPDNPKYIEGKVDGQQIVLITDFVKKSS